MTNGSGVSPGDRNRNARLVRLRTAVPVTNAIVGITWLIASRWSWCAIMIPEFWPARRSGAKPGPWMPPWSWAADRAARAGFAGVTVACEPTGTVAGVGPDGRRAGGWRSFLRGRRRCRGRAGAEDLTSDKSDEKDAVLIARSQPSCSATCLSRLSRPGAGYGTSGRGDPTHRCPGPNRPLGRANCGPSSPPAGPGTQPSQPTGWQTSRRPTWPDPRRAYQLPENQVASLPGIETPSSAHITGGPTPRRTNPIKRCREPTPLPLCRPTSGQAPRH